VRFAIDATAAGSAARAGTLHTRTTAVATPAFMPVGTRGSVRTQAPSQVAALGARMLLANTYHLVQRPASTRCAGSAAWLGGSAGTARSSPTRAASRSTRWRTRAPSTTPARGSGRTATGRSSC
jgi:hypothetical protein